MDGCGGFLRDPCPGDVTHVRPGSQQRLRLWFEPRWMPPFQENALSDLSLESFNYLCPGYKLHKHLRAVLSKGLRPRGRAAAKVLGEWLLPPSCPSPLHTQLHFSMHARWYVKKIFSRTETCN